MVNGNPISSYHLPKTAITISFDALFEEQEARVYSGLSVAEYDKLAGDPQYATEDQPVSKAQIIALYRLHKIINAIVANEQSKKRRR